MEGHVSAGSAGAVGDVSPLDDRVGVIAFNVGSSPHALVAAVLGYAAGIGVRSGCFCTQLYVGDLHGRAEGRPDRWQAKGHYFQIDFNVHTLSEVILALVIDPKNSTPRLAADGYTRLVNTRSPSFTKTSTEEASTNTMQLYSAVMNRERRIIHAGKLLVKRHVA